MSDVTTPLAASRLVGGSISRVDGRLKVTGQADYTADHEFPGMAWACAVKSTIATGRVVELDTTAAQNLRGVVAVFTARNRPKIYPPKKDAPGFMVGEHWAPLDGDEVHYYGQDLAYVVAETYEQAREAAGLVRITYVATEPIASMAQAKLKPPDTVFGQKPHVEKKAGGTGSVEDAWNRSAVKIDVTYDTPFEHHHPMEPHAVVAKWDDDRLTYYTPTQWMYGTRDFLAHGLSVPKEHVRVISHYIGGAFGSKGASWMYMLLIAAFARDLRRPVKFVMERESMFTSVGHRPHTQQRIQLGASRAGVLEAMRHFTKSSLTPASTFVEGAGHLSSGVLYATPNLELDHEVYPLDLSAPIFMRAPGESPGVFALESAMDELAVALGQDPVRVRLANMTDRHPVSDLPFSSRNLDECYRVAGRKFGWEKRAPAPRSTPDGDWWIGWGMATATYPARRSAAQARVRILADGTAEVDCASQDLGTGTYTIVAQTAGDELRLPLEKIRARLGDSTYPSAPVSGGSQSAASILPAVQLACRSALSELAKLAIAHPGSPLYAAKEADLQPHEGALELTRNPAKRQSFAAILAQADKGAVEALGAADPAAEKQDKRRQHFYSQVTTAYQSFGAFFAEVRVHRLTCETRVTRIVAAMDIGQPLNLKTARSQIIGGAVFGIGAALSEHSVLDARSGRWITQDLGTYHVPVHADVPVIDVEFVGPPDLKFNSLGARGIGEIGNTGSAAAIGNAIYHATGARVRELPITPEKILAALPHEGTARVG